MHPPTTLPTVKENCCIKDFKLFLEALQDKKKRFVVFLKENSEILYYVRGAKNRPHFLKYYYKQGEKWISDRFTETESLGLMLSEVKTQFPKLESLQ